MRSFGIWRRLFECESCELLMHQIRNGVVISFLHISSIADPIEFTHAGNVVAKKIFRDTSVISARPYRH